MVKTRLRLLRGGPVSIVHYGANYKYQGQIVYCVKHEVNLNVIGQKQKPQLRCGQWRTDKGPPIFRLLDIFSGRGLGTQTHFFSIGFYFDTTVKLHDKNKSRLLC
jgi:hypothetical protein